MKTKLPLTDFKTVSDACAHPDINSGQKKQLVALAKTVNKEPTTPFNCVGFVHDGNNFIYRVEPRGIIECVRVMSTARFSHLKK